MLDGLSRRAGSGVLPAAGWGSFFSGNTDTNSSPSRYNNGSGGAGFHSVVAPGQPDRSNCVGVTVLH